MEGEKEEEKRRVARVMAAAMMETVLERGWCTLVEKMNKVKERRLGRAAISTLTARTKNWTLCITSSPKRKRDIDWHNLGTPPKKSRGGGSSVTTSPGVNNEIDPPKINRGENVKQMKPLAVPAQERSPFPAVQQGRKKSMVTVSSTTSVQEKITLFEVKQGGGPLKKYQKPKKLQVKTRKWVKKKNGLFGWITSVGGPGKS